MAMARDGELLRQDVCLFVDQKRTLKRWVWIGGPGSILIKKYARLFELRT